MGKVVAFNLMSLDGYACGPDGDLMALPFGESFDTYCVERLATAGVLLLGRASFEGFRGFWPDVQYDRSATADQREISRRNTAITKVVVSDTLDAHLTGPWADSTRVIRRLEAHRAIAGLKRHTAGEVLVFGSITLWHDLFEHGLVDELHLMIGAVILGGGVAALPVSRAKLSLIGSRQVPGDDRALLRYARNG